jgi:hypothetical protein
MATNTTAATAPQAQTPIRTLSDKRRKLRRSHPDCSATAVAVSVSWDVIRLHSQRRANRG